MSRLVTVHCPNCDTYFKVKLQKQANKGDGAEYAREMTKLSPQHQLILDVLKWCGAFDELGGMTWRRILYECRDAAAARKEGFINPKGLSGRLSELRGAGLIESARNEIELKDRETMQFRHKNRKSLVYWLKREAPKMEMKPLEPESRELASYVWRG